MNDFNDYEDETNLYCGDGVYLDITDFGYDEVVVESKSKTAAKIARDKAKKGSYC